jgi:hypothetical protein
MGEWLVKTRMIGFILWVLWSFVQPRYIFVIRISRGRPSIRRGRVTREFLVRVANVCQEEGVFRGWIGGVQQGRRISLRFSRQFPTGPQQRLRNDWGLTD